MLFRDPLPFREALDSRQVRQLLPTDFRTRLLAEIPSELRERAMFSAGVTNVEFLQRTSDAIDDLVSGKVDRATKRAELKQVLASLDYQPAEGEQGSLTDLSSDRRLNLILDTNLQMAQGYGHWAEGQRSDILDQWPAQELIRVRDAAEPRDWSKRWEEAGGEFFDGRMIALKNSPVWLKISAFQLPYPPFDFNSGMDVIDVSRDEAIDLGLIDRDTELLPESRDFNTDLQATPEVRSAALQEALLDQVGTFAKFVGGVLRYVGGAA